MVSTLLYGSQTWSLSYIDRLERGQVVFFLISETPCPSTRYAVRIETRLRPVFIPILHLMSKWITKIFKMPKEWYPKICFIRLMQMKLRRNEGIQHNWVPRKELL